jgi:alkylated DNA repair dioxygenase AlkB
LADCSAPGNESRIVGGGVAVAGDQSDLFGQVNALPDGFRYQPAILDHAEADMLLECVQSLSFREFEFHGFLGKRRVVSFGWRYDFNGDGLSKTEDMPNFLLSLRAKAAAFAGMAPTDLQQVLVTQYRPGAAIGWHKDRSVFGDVIGISLLSPCTFRLRRRCGKKWERASITIDPRSIYLLRDSSRNDWEHSISAVDALRYSLTFHNALIPGRAA